MKSRSSLTSLNLSSSSIKATNTANDLTTASLTLSPLSSCNICCMIDKTRELRNSGYKGQEEREGKEEGERGRKERWRDKGREKKKREEGEK